MTDCSIESARALMSTMDSGDDDAREDANEQEEEASEA